MKSTLQYTNRILLMFFSGFSLVAQIGINTDNPQTTLDINGDLALNAGSLVLNNGNNDIAADEYSLFNISGPTADFIINTIEPLTDVDGQIITLVNTTNYKMTLAHNVGAGPNSIYCTSGSDLVIKGVYSTITLQYIKSSERWLAVKYGDGGASKKTILSSVGLLDASTDSSDFSDMMDMGISFTPKSPVVYVNVSMSGHMGLLGSDGKAAQGYGDFRLVKTVGGTTSVVAGFTTLATDSDYRTSSLTAWNARVAMYPVFVTPGQATTLQVEWRRDGHNPGILYCRTEFFRNNSHRSITVIE